MGTSFTFSILRFPSSRAHHLGIAWILIAVNLMRGTGELPPRLGPTYGPQTSERVLPCAALFARKLHAHLPWSGQDAVRRAALPAFTLDTSLAPFNGEGVTLQRLFHQTFGFGAHRFL